MQLNRKKKTLSLFTEIFKERAISMWRENEYKDTVCFKPLFTVYVKEFKDEDWIYICENIVIFRDRGHSFKTGKLQNTLQMGF